MNDDALIALVVLLVGIVLYHLSRPDPREFFAPPVMVAAIFFFYAVLAPRDAIHTGETTIFFLDALPAYPLVWRVVILYLIAFLLGYHLLRSMLPRLRPGVPVPAEGLAVLGYRICLWSTLIYGLSQGFGFLARLNPLEARGVVVDYTPVFAFGVLSNYAAYAINLLVLGILFQLPLAFESPSNRINAAGWIAFTTALYVGFSFRWRVALLFAALLIVWHLWQGRRPSWGLLLALPLLLVVSGAMGVNRQYGAGLDTDALVNLDVEGLLRPTLSEGKNVFNMTALLINDVQQRQAFVGFGQPLLAVFTTVIPRQLLPGKDIANYLKQAFVDVFGDPIVAQAGLAVLNVGEYFLILGWIGVFLIGIASGFGARVLWSWYRLNQQDPFVLCVYTLALSFIYLLISRGFTPGVVILASFTFLPFLVFGRQLRAFLVAHS